ncbi:MAG: hypothetical protein GY855_02025 [candidate division Zixibacteria bacterium]|nr:hypothetical protein [candidate division Zixibacteria bacterium]
MKKITTTIPILIIALGLILSGCSKNSTQDNDTTNDEIFAAARVDADTTVLECIDDNNQMCDWFVGGMGPLALSDSVEIDSTDFWHIFIRNFQNDYITHSVADSFRFTDIDGEYQYRPDSTTNQFERRLKKFFEKEARGNGTSWTKERNRNMLWVGLADSVTVLNGDIYRYHHGENEYRDFSREFEGDFLDVKFYSEDIYNGRPTHPFEGTLAGSTFVDKEVNGQTLHIEASLTVTFYPDHFHVLLQSGDSYREWDHYYQP